MLAALGKIQANFSDSAMVQNPLCYKFSLFINIPMWHSLTEFAVFDVKASGGPVFQPFIYSC